MAAKAVPMDEFAPALDRLLALNLKRLTLYASHGDLAMKTGFLAELAVLAGHTTGGELLVHPGLHSIDITSASAKAAASGAIALTDSCARRPPPKRTAPRSRHSHLAIPT